MPLQCLESRLGRVGWHTRHVPGLSLRYTLRRELRWRRDAVSRSRSRRTPRSALLCQRLTRRLIPTGSACSVHRCSGLSRLRVAGRDSLGHFQVHTAAVQVSETGKFAWRKVWGWGAASANVQDPQRGAARAGSTPVPPSPPLPLRNLGAPPFSQPRSHARPEQRLWGDARAARGTPAARRAVALTPATATPGAAASRRAPGTPPARPRSPAPRGHSASCRRVTLPARACHHAAPPRSSRGPLSAARTRPPRPLSTHSRRAPRGSAPRPARSPRACRDPGPALPGRGGGGQYLGEAVRGVHRWAPGRERGGRPRRGQARQAASRWLALGLRLRCSGLRRAAPARPAAPLGPPPLRAHRLGPAGSGPPPRSPLPLASAAAARLLHAAAARPVALARHRRRRRRAVKVKV